MGKSISIYIPNESKQSLGGGWTFLRNFKKAFSKYGDVKFVSQWQDCDILFIVGATLTPRDEVVRAKEAGKKIVFRVDNIPKDSRNRGTAFSRMIDYARLADVIVFQSEWAKDYAGWWFVDNSIDINTKGRIIYNGVDTDFFYEDSSVKNNNRYIVVQYNRDENKRIPEAFYIFHQAYRENKDIELFVVGQFSPELVTYNFDFFAGERVHYVGVVEDPKQMGDMFRSSGYLIFPAFADAAPNTVLEARACGCEIVGVNATGGTIEMLELPKVRTIETMGEEYRMVFEDIL